MAATRDKQQGRRAYISFNSLLSEPLSFDKQREIEGSVTLEDKANQRTPETSTPPIFPFSLPRTRKITREDTPENSPARDLDQRTPETSTPPIFPSSLPRKRKMTRGGTPENSPARDLAKQLISQAAIQYIRKLHNLGFSITILSEELRPLAVKALLKALLLEANGQGITTRKIPQVQGSPPGHTKSLVILDLEEKIDKSSEDIVVICDDTENCNTIEKGISCAPGVTPSIIRHQEKHNNRLHFDAFIKSLTEGVVKAPSPAGTSQPPSRGKSTSRPSSYASSPRRSSVDSPNSSPSNSPGRNSYYYSPSSRHPSTNSPNGSPYNNNPRSKGTQPQLIPTRKQQPPHSVSAPNSLLNTDQTKSPTTNVAENSPSQQPFSRSANTATALLPHNLRLNTGPTGSFIPNNIEYCQTQPPSPRSVSSTSCFFQPKKIALAACIAAGIALKILVAVPVYGWIIFFVASAAVVAWQCIDSYQSPSLRSR